MISTPKDKSDFIKAASIAYLAEALVFKFENPLTPKVCVAAAIDIAEDHWEDLKRRGHV